MNQSVLKEQPFFTEQVLLNELSDFGVGVFIRRLDKIHPLVGGNKFFKLKYNLRAAIKEGKNTLLTFGGAYSNHIIATAAAAHECGMTSIGIIRGETVQPLNPTLQLAESLGMQLESMDRASYRKKMEPEIQWQLTKTHGDFYLIPEGGTNEWAIQGAAEILKPSDESFDHIVCAVGTGGTFAGLASVLASHQNLWGYSALKGDFIQQEIKDLLLANDLVPQGNFQLITEYHFGGYAKFRPELLRFIQAFKKETNIPLDPIYTGKMMFGLLEMIKSGKFNSGSKILVIHSGGLQGIKGFNERHGTQLQDT